MHESNHTCFGGILIIIMLSGTPSTAALVFVLITGFFLFAMLFDITCQAWWDAQLAARKDKGNSGLK